MGDILTILFYIIQISIYFKYSKYIRSFCAYFNILTPYIFYSVMLNVIIPLLRVDQGAIRPIAFDLPSLVRLTSRHDLGCS